MVYNFYQFTFPGFPFIFIYYLHTCIPYNNFCLVKVTIILILTMRKFMAVKFLYYHESVCNSVSVVFCYKHLKIIAIVIQEIVVSLAQIFYSIRLNPISLLLECIARKCVRVSTHWQLLVSVIKLFSRLKVVCCSSQAPTGN